MIGTKALWVVCFLWGLEALGGGKPWLLSTRAVEALRAILLAHVRFPREDS